MSVLARCFEAALFGQEWALSKSPLLQEMVTEYAAVHGGILYWIVDCIGEDPRYFCELAAEMAAGIYAKHGAPCFAQAVRRGFAPYVQ